jgi:hypothetical protein
MIWWLENPARARSERQSVADLSERVSWLRGVRWYLSDGAAFAVDFEIEHDGDSIPLTMTYAEFHPNAPPIVVPRDGSRLSSHQYGAGGNLCLEYRADNWETAITGAMMIESARRLIAGERDVDGPELPSAHAVSLGQSVRGSYFRFLLTQPIEERLKGMEPGQSIEIGIAEKYHAETFTVTIAEIDAVSDARAWPAGIRETTKCGHAIRLPRGKAMPAAAQESIAEFLGDLGFATLREHPRELRPGRFQGRRRRGADFPQHAATRAGTSPAAAATPSVARLTRGGTAAHSDVAAYLRHARTSVLTWTRHYGFTRNRKPALPSALLLSPRRAFDDRDMARADCSRHQPRRQHHRGTSYLARSAPSRQGSDRHAAGGQWAIFSATRSASASVAR